eukprot:CAMPEP_0196810840 /NCGR_PEP_ID=MMETSP1362-20130617/14588_1 /TAXON_ID=163516 /ORGANISM="Leptocylindrus danicus, Strain CCMP1856" /LENGTH=136 /DNA_ID=CAMNT_0042186001 /DNA_START=21 /DNA_END=431 /DNA_ORIENTATION=+
MATRGIKQLQTLRVVYCEHGGSSRYIRDFIRNGPIVKFAEQNPSVQVDVQLRPGKHPYIKGEYLTGSDKQVCVKNEPLNRIWKVVEMLNNSSGRKMVKFDKPVVTNTPSVQGVWSPMLEIAGQEWKIDLKQGGSSS